MCGVCVVEQPCFNSAQAQGGKRGGGKWSDAEHALWSNHVQSGSIERQSEGQTWFNSAEEHRGGNSASESDKGDKNKLQGRVI
jgi:hypothetical protein